MAFRRRSRPVARQTGVARFWALCRAVLLLSARMALTVAALAVIASGIVYLRLLQGPIALPGIARMMAEQVNQASERLHLEVGDVVLTLGEGAATSGLQFRDVEVRSPDGQPLLAAPRVGARFHLSDLLHGRLQPVRITLIEPDAQIIRAEDGRVRFGMGKGEGVRLRGGGGGADGDAGDADGNGADRERARLAAVARLVDGLVGDLPPVPELAKLERIEILGANLTFDDRRGGGHWSTDNADLRLWRYPGGARAVLDLEPVRETGTALSIVADRPAGLGRTDLRLQFDGIESDRLARQARELDWLRLIGGRVAGEASATLERDGRLSALEGVVVAENGTVRGPGAPVRFDTAELQFVADPAGDRLTIERFRLSAPAFSATLAGYADLDRDPGGAVQGLAGQFDIGALRVDMPGTFAGPLDFDGGRVTARWSMPGQRIEVTGARLTRGEMALTLEGQARATGSGWLTDMRAEVEALAVDDLVALWPVSGAGNARAWIDEHVIAGRIDRATAQMRLGGPEPRISAAFDYTGLHIDYIDGMSPVEAGRGSGHVSLQDLFMEMDAGLVSPLAGEAIELAGSSLAIRSFWGDVSPAEVSIRARGPADAALALIDQPPLRLPARLGRDLDIGSGTATVEAELVIPLRKKLRLAEIGVESRAVLAGVALPFEITPGRTVGIRADRMEITADMQSLHLSAAALIEGAPVTIDWNERYGAGEDGRTIELSGEATAGLLAGVGAQGLPVRGAPPFELELRQAGGGALAFTLEADLQPAEVEVAGLGWTKPPGVPGRLQAEGTREDGLDIRALTLDSPGLDAQGSMRLDRGGGLERAAFPHVRMPGRGTFAATLHRAPDGVLEVGITGRQLDLSDRVERAEGGGGSDGGAAGGEADPVAPVRLSLDVDRLELGDRITLAPARGRVEQHVSGALEAGFEGRLGAAPARLDIDIPARGAGTVRLTSPDAGAVLRATELYTDARGGTLVLEAQVGGDEPGLRGEARIEDVRVRSQSTFRMMLRQGGLDAAGQEVASNGIGFRRVSIPFSYHDGIVRLKDAIAASPALGLKVSGTIDERIDQVDLVGVLSPAYGLTGALNEVPLLGALLGGEGEGVLAMTFRLRGPVEDPRFTVNPLSMLAPGFLRKIFTAPSSEVSEDFREGITPQNR